MSVESNFDNQSFISCEIDGNQYILEKWLENECDTGLQLLQESASALEKNTNDENEQLPDHSANNSVPFVCLDEQIFAIRDGELQEIDLSQLISLNVDHNKKMVISKENFNNDVGQDIYSVDHKEVLKDPKKTLIDKDCLNDSDIAEVVSAFKCKVCPFTTQDKNLLMQHFLNIHLNTNNGISNEDTQEQVQGYATEMEEVKLVYICGQCSDCFSTMEKCKEHMINVHSLISNTLDKKKESSKSEVKNVESEITKKLPKSLKSNIPHNNQNDNFKERYIKCKIRNCSYKFTNNEKMQQHFVCHVDIDGTNYFKCSICKDLKFTKWRPCSLHLWKNHQIDVDLYSCTICEAYKSATLVKLMTHMKVHSEYREYQCMECGKCFKQSSQLRNHRVMHLDRKTSDVSRWYTSKKCETCGKIYADSKCLKNHIQAVHSKLKPFVCNVCGHSCARKAMLQMHLRQHTGDKPFSCNTCDYKTGDHNSLRRHIMRHTGDRPYKCPHCSYSAIQSNSYKNHLRSKHPMQSGVFVCELCPFRTVRNETYIQHVEFHEKGLIKKFSPQKENDENPQEADKVDVFPGNVAAAQLIYNCLGAFSKSIKANLMSSCTSADGTSQTITIEIPSKYLEESFPTSSTTNFEAEQEDDETMHCFLKIPREEDENVDTGGITIPAEPE